MSSGCETRLIPNAYTRKHAFIQCPWACRKRRRLLPRCCSSRTIQRCLTNGPFRTGWRLSRTARCSPVRSDRLAMRERTECTPAQRATNYLKRIAALTGAKHVCGESYRLRAGRMHFLVDSKFVRVISPRTESTCFSVAADPDMPSAEVVASALLQLKNNARLFEKWREWPAHTFKANGKMRAFDFHVGHNYCQHFFVNIDSRYFVKHCLLLAGAESVLQLP